MEIVNLQSIKWFLSEEKKFPRSTIELILQGSDTTGKHMGFYGVTAAHTFLTESQQRALITDGRPSTVMSVWEEVEASNKEQKYLMSTDDHRFPSVDIVGPPYLFYRRWYPNASTGYPLVDISLFKLDQKQLEEAHQLMREVHSQPGEKNSRFDHIRIACSKVKKIESLEDLYSLRGRSICCNGKIGRILQPRVPGNGDVTVGQHLRFTMNDRESFRPGDSGSLVYLMGNDDQQSYILGMFVGTYAKDPPVHQAVILSKALSMIGESQPFQQMNLEIPTLTSQPEFGIGRARQEESELVKVSETTDEASSENYGDSKSSVDRIPDKAKISVSGETEKAESETSETPDSPSFTGDPSPVEKSATDGQSSTGRIPDEAKTSVSGESEKAESKTSETPDSPRFTGDPRPVERSTIVRARQEESELVKVSETTDKASSENYGDGESSVDRIPAHAKTSVFDESEKAESETSETPDSPSFTGDSSPVEKSTTEQKFTVDDPCGGQDSFATRLTLAKLKELDGEWSGANISDCIMVPSLNFEITGPRKERFTWKTPDSEYQRVDIVGHAPTSNDNNKKEFIEHQDSDTQLEAKSKESEDQQKVIAELTKPNEEKAEDIESELKPASSRAEVTDADVSELEARMTASTIEPTPPGQDVKSQAAGELSKSKTEQYTPHIPEGTLNWISSKKNQPDEISVKASNEASDYIASASCEDDDKDDDDDDDDDDDGYKPITQDDVDQIARVCKEHGVSGIEVIQNPFQHQEVLVTCAPLESNKQQLKAELNATLKDYIIEVLSKSEEKSLVPLGGEKSLPLMCKKPGRCQLFVHSQNSEDDVFAVSAAHLLFEEEEYESARFEHYETGRLKRIVQAHPEVNCTLTVGKEKISIPRNKCLVFYNYYPENSQEQFLMDAFLMPLMYIDAKSALSELQNTIKSEPQTITKTQLQTLHKNRAWVAVKQFTGRLVSVTQVGDIEERRLGLRLQFRLEKDHEEQNVLVQGDSGSIVYRTGPKGDKRRKCSPIGVLAYRDEKESFYIYNAVVLSQLFDKVQSRGSEYAKLQLFQG